MIEQGITINGRYRVDRLLGEGGMATVYLGHDLLLGRDVAIKALRPQYAADPGFRARFRREAQAAAGFAHPNIIDIYDVGELAGVPYFVMEYVRGQTLREIIDREGPFHPDDVAGLLQQLCAALDYAHERGYVHRDVKPQNILGTDDGHAIVADFGSAKGLADSDLTDAGGGMGTIHYISPEQASGLIATPASDIYSAGIVAYEMLTRMLPFEAETPVGVAMQHIQEPPPPPSSLLPSIPPAVDAVVLRALEKDPTRRFPSAGAFARAMTYWRQYRPPVAAAAAPPQPSRGAAAAPEFPPRTAGEAATAPLPSQAPRAATPPRPTREELERDLGRSRGGCSTWMVAAVVLAGLAALIFAGIRLGGIPSPGGSNPLSGGATSTPLPTRQPPATIQIAATVGPSPTPAPVIEAPPTAPPPTPAPTVPPTAAPPSAVAVPDFVGRTISEAAALAASQGLTLEIGPYLPSDQYPLDAVVVQDPPPGDTVEPGGSVLVQPSSGPAGVNLDGLNLTGMAANEAERTLRDLGLMPQRLEVGSRDVPEGSVAGYEPSGEVYPGDAVVLKVSMGDRVQIPVDIQGIPVDEAAQRLKSLGFRIGQRFGADRKTIEASGIDLAAAGIEDQDLVGVQGRDAGFGAWMKPGSSIDLVYFDRKGGG
ncbi:MAG: protein kinase domain-containing protein [Chloroflexota bacterium]